MDQKKLLDGAGLPSAAALPAPSPVCFFPRIEGVDFSVSSCSNFDSASGLAVQPFEHCEFCQCWDGGAF